SWPSSRTAVCHLAPGCRARTRRRGERRPDPGRAAVEAPVRRISASADGSGGEDPVDLSLYVREPERRLGNEEHQPVEHWRASERAVFAGVLLDREDFKLPGPGGPDERLYRCDRRVRRLRVGSIDDRVNAAKARAGIPEGGDL